MYAFSGVIFAAAQWGSTTRPIFQIRKLEIGEVEYIDQVITKVVALEFETKTSLTLELKFMTVRPGPI